MEFTEWLERLGVAQALALGGLALGLLFGFMAQRSRFCLRAAVVEFWHDQFGTKLTVWLLTFSTAVIAIQVLLLAGWLDVSGTRQMANRGSLSGALVGGLCFGAGMIMTRGCASRLLVLSANGNLRALLSGLIFAVTAQSALSGALSPLRQEIATWWTVEGGPSRDLLAVLGLGHEAGLAIGVVWAAAAVYFARHRLQGFWTWAGGIGVGLCVAMAWWYSYQVSQHTFDVVAVQGITFSGPSAEWLMRVLAPSPPPIGFDFGLLPGVFLGSFIAAWTRGEWKLEGFKDGYGMRRYIAGAVLMGFGAMLAGGCAVGAGVTGGAIFSMTAWLALIGMWFGAGLVDRWMDPPLNSAPTWVQP